MGKCIAMIQERKYIKPMMFFHPVAIDLASEIEKREDVTAETEINRKEDGQQYMTLEEVEKEYQKMLSKLEDDAKYETALVVRLLMETGIPGEDIYKIKPECIVERRVILRSSKNGERYFYHEELGYWPTISEETEKLMQNLMDWQGKLFIKPYLHHIFSLTEYVEDKRLRMVDLTWYRREMMKKGSKWP